MQPLAVVEAFDVSNDRHPCGVPGGEGLAMDQLVLPRSKVSVKTGPSQPDPCSFGSAVDGANSATEARQ